ncbi:MAG: hypothetical protein NTX46_06230 [Chloroflexi bacterium]|nr:hypothetical protein [Chloroflexota bacterium]
METTSHNKPCCTWKPIVGGILSIIAGAVAVLVGVGALLRGDFIDRMMWHWRWEVVGVLALILGIVAIIGGVFAIKRKVWGLALAGAICALFPPHVCILGILAIIFVALSKEEFGQPSSRVGGGTTSQSGTSADSKPTETT